MAGIINTTKALNNDPFYSGGIDSETLNNTTIAISPFVSDQYDYSITEDPILLQERKDTAEKLYEIYKAAPFYSDYQKDENMRIPKEDILKVFYYMKEHLAKVKQLSTFETVIAINEFFDFNYDYIAKKVLSPKMLAELLEDYYCNMGMANKMDEIADNPLF